ncbi:alpha/beta hydrolase [Ornithinimicrobium sp. F0845]|uniref:alpha/beta fold hydrolase n=1 Tax=Ornithinimicrobium sp. F0845 TaxID=2926412 RepID=UPI001FF527CD|nr:alpha/beta hydrolase [Ornithinimicrobium sp. F0845]MCK0111536.1 alpha/beta hydrolase [Ornithinimicrobium sp. F0845]
MATHKSTIVRAELHAAVPPGTPTPRPPRAPALVRAFLRVTDPVAPGLSARVAEALWFRLSPTPRGIRHLGTPAGGTPFTTRGDGLAVHGRTYGPEGAPTAYLVHGWAGWWQQLAALVQPLVDAGFRVVAYDAPSHGDSAAGAYGPRSSRVMEMADAYALVVRDHGPADLVVAHSIGAMATMWAAARGTGAGAYAFVAAAASVEPMLHTFGHTLHLGHRTRRRMAARIERRIGHPFAAFDVPDLARSVAGAQAAPRLLAVHDRDDRMTPVSGSVAITRAWPGSELRLTDGLGHRRILSHPETIARVASFGSHRPQRTGARTGTGTPLSPSTAPEQPRHAEPCRAQDR